MTEDTQNKIFDECTRTLIGSGRRLLERAASKNVKSTTFLDVGTLNGKRYRGLLFFDLAHLRESAEKENMVVKSATLSLNWYYSVPQPQKSTDDTSGPVTVGVFSAPAGTYDKRDAVTWDSCDGWVDKNGDKNGGTPWRQLVLSPGDKPDNRYHTIDITNYIQKYIDGVIENDGFLLKTDEKSSYIAFKCGGGAVSETDTVPASPRLTVVFVEKDSSDATGGEPAEKTTDSKNQYALILECNEESLHIIVDAIKEMARAGDVDVGCFSPANVLFSLGAG